MNSELIASIVTAVVCGIIRAVEKRKLKKCGKLKDTPDTLGNSDSDKK